MICCLSEGFRISQKIDNLYLTAGSHYDEPKFVWQNSSSVTALVFMNTTKLGKQYLNDLFVGDMRGNIYHFDLHKNREI